MQIERLGHSPISLVLTLAFLNFILRVLLFSQMTSLMTILEDYFNWKGNEETLSCNKYIPLSSQSRLTSMACISLFLLHQCLPMCHQSVRIHHPTLAIVKSPFPSAPPSSRGN